MSIYHLLIYTLALAIPLSTVGQNFSEKPRIIIETDAGGDPDDEQSLVRFLVYANELDIEGIIANREKARDRENLNSVRTGFGIVQKFLQAYGECYPYLKQNAAGYPSPEYLQKITVPGYAHTDAGVNRIIEAVDKKDPRPVWFCNWGTDAGSAESCLKRALDRILFERGLEGYARFKSRIRLSSSDEFGDHTWKIAPSFPLWINTFQPEIDSKRWYHQFSVLTARAGGFDIERDVRNNHGPLGELYPTNTNRPQKEGDSMSFLYLLLTGMNDPDHPSWGSWAGRYGIREDAGGRSYYWANLTDKWKDSVNRNNTLLRWATDLQNDFRTRLEWCIRPFKETNHPPVVKINIPSHKKIKAGTKINIDASLSTDPDGDELETSFEFYQEAGTYTGELPTITSKSMKAEFIAPIVNKNQTLHLLIIVGDKKAVPLYRYKRVVFTIQSNV